MINGKFFKKINFDERLLIIPLLLAVLYLFLIHQYVGLELYIFLFFYTLASEVHVYSTFFHLSRDKVLKHLGENPVKGFIIPLIILISCPVLIYFGQLVSLFAFSLIVSTHHVSMQSFAFVSLSRTNELGNIRQRRSWEKNAVVFTAFAILIISISQRYPKGFFGYLFFNFLSYHLKDTQISHQVIFNVVALLSLIIGLLNLAKILKQDYFGQKRNGLLYYVVLLFSMLQFLPFYFVKDSKHASIVALMGHNIQYMVIVIFALNYSGSNVFFDKSYFSKKTKLIFFIFSLIFLSFVTATSRLNAFGVKHYLVLLLKPLLGVSIGIQVLHYYYDSFIWKITDNRLNNVLSRSRLGSSKIG